MTIPVIMLMGLTLLFGAVICLGAALACKRKGLRNDGPKTR